MKEFFFELFFEEIPAKTQLFASSEVCRLFNELTDGVVDHADPKAFVTPRRLAFVCEVEEYTIEARDLVRGPQTCVSDVVVQKFAESRGIKISDCFKEMVGTKEYWFYTDVCDPKKFVDVVPGLISGIINGFKWPKTMIWNSGHTRWVRPLRNVFACFDGLPVPLDVAGVGNSGTLLGHRVHGGGFEARNFAEYVKKLRENGVVLDFFERRDVIVHEIHEIEKKHSVEIRADGGLLDEVTGLVEHPKVVLGQIPEHFLSLPEEIIVDCMAHHQKFMPVFKSNRLAPHFISVCNIDFTLNYIKGNERVLNARLSDAKFFFDNDRKSSLESRFDRLAGSSFYPKLGSVQDRVNRIRAVASAISDELGLSSAILDRAAMLAKCDLVTEVVYEFPELQGVIGAIYAQLDGESDEVSGAIAEQYLPAGVDGAIPKSQYGAALSLADKIEMLISFFHVGQKLKGSKDPLGLRRAGIGIVRVILGHALSIDLRAIAFRAQRDMHYDEDPSYFLTFIVDRLIQILGVPENLIKAMTDLNAEVDLLKIKQRYLELGKYAEDDEILAPYKRLCNTIHGVTSQGIVDEKLLSDGAEFTFYKAVHDLGCDARPREYMEKLRGLGRLVDDFLDTTHVNVDDQDVRRNRIALVSEAVRSYEKYIKFSLLF